MNRADLMVVRRGDTVVPSQDSIDSKLPSLVSE